MGIDKPTRYKDKLHYQNTLTYNTTHGERTIEHTRGKPVSVVYLDKELTDDNREEWRSVVWNSGCKNLSIRSKEGPPKFLIQVRKGEKNTDREEKFT